MAFFSLTGRALIINFWDLSKYFDKEVLADVMDSLFRAGIRGKLYRLWNEFNSRSVVQVVTPGGVSDKRVTGANVGQGTVGGGLISSLGLSEGMSDTFGSSTAEICYGPVRLEPTIYQDDIAKCSSTFLFIHFFFYFAQRYDEKLKIEAFIDPVKVIGHNFFLVYVCAIWSKGLLSF